MFTGYPVEHHESGTRRRNNPPGPQRPRCVIQRNLAPIKPTGDGVSTYLALTFGTLLSSQGTDASFVLTLSGFPPGASPSVLQTLSVFFRLSDHRPADMQNGTPR
ncbi:hypothetical protein E4K10_07415 [Streptomyces sp. T1317-0309]|nr:hypothetical protein E4K10_07415 [Streptomyces sp. T1317-0309]